MYTITFLVIFFLFCFLNFLYVNFVKFYSSTLRAYDTQLNPFTLNGMNTHSTYKTKCNFVCFFLRVLQQIYVEIICEFSSCFCWCLHFSFLFRCSRLVCVCFSALIYEWTMLLLLQLLMCCQWWWWEWIFFASSFSQFTNTQTLAHSLSHACSRKVPDNVDLPHFLMIPNIYLPYSFSMQFISPISLSVAFFMNIIFISISISLLSWYYDFISFLFFDLQMDTFFYLYFSLWNFHFGLRQSTNAQHTLFKHLCFNL